MQERDPAAKAIVFSQVRRRLIKVPQSAPSLFRSIAAYLFEPRHSSVVGDTCNFHRLPDEAHGCYTFFVHACRLPPTHAARETSNVPQFVNMLDLIEFRMRKGGVGCRKLSGHLSIDKRDEASEMFLRVYTGSMTYVAIVDSPTPPYPPPLYERGS